MSFRTRLLIAIEVILRVPPLFVIDELSSTGFDFPEQVDSSTPVENNNSTLSDFSFGVGATYDAQFYKFLIFAIIKTLLSCLGCTAALCVFLLSLEQLFVVYMYLMSVGIIFVSYWANVFTVKAMTLDTMTTHASILEDILNLNFIKILQPSSIGFIVVQNYVLQLVLSVLFVFTYSYIGPKYPVVNKLLPFSFLAPSILAILPLSSPLVIHSPVFAALLPLAMVKYVLCYSAVPVVQTIYTGYQRSRNIINNFGLSTLIETEWVRLNVPCILQTFWLLRVAEHAIILIIEHYRAKSSDETVHSNFISISALLLMCKSLLITGCESLTALLGMASVVSYICHYICCFFQWILLTEDEDDKSIGVVSAILFYVLALQSGLTSLDPEKRFIRLAKNFCLLCTAVLHFIHNIVNPLLLSLSASYNPSLHRHLRALAVCGFLICFPLSLLYYLWSQHISKSWLLAVSAFSIEAIIKVLVSLALYTLFLIDAYRSTFWEKLDDYVYYIRAFGNTVEFCFGIFLFLNGAWILVFEAGGAIRAVTMCIHAYFNIWCEAQAGWSSFMKRRTAVSKINLLPEANEEQLIELDDLCAICFQEMKSAKITRCNHFFHGVCLRKWLYVQDRCPLCHNILYKTEAERKGESTVAPRPNENSNIQNQENERQIEIN
ncbi:hypothetical protein RUM43_013144 [Polyplax serrata]|uniref:RING-type domain-containing protein n=1 Tax=Polyplax serrata TaxID=468196 RepID=A0AAN8RZ65_POLSC